jgi:hypothetical protein
MIEPTFVPGLTVVVCDACSTPLVANVGRAVERARPRTVLLWWACDVCEEISAAIPFPARFLSADVGSLGDVRRDGAEGLQPTGVARATPRVLPR